MTLQWHLLTAAGLDSWSPPVLARSGSLSLPFEGDLVLAGVQFLPVMLPQVCFVIMPLCLLPCYYAPFIRRILNFSQVILVYTISMSYNKS